MKAKRTSPRTKKAALGNRKPSHSSRPAKHREADGKQAVEWNLRLYVAGQTPKSLSAFANLKNLCEQHLANRYQIEVVDLTKQPHLAQNDQIVALPTLVRKLPEPIKRLIGDLSDVQRVLVGMEINKN